MKQLEFKKVRGWGGKRRGAGRKSSGLVSHGKRERIDFKKPALITMKLKPRTAHLRNRELLKEFKRAVSGAKAHGLNVLHYSLQGDHLHMIIEAQSVRRLGCGMKSFGSRFGKAIRRAIGGTGSVFKGRYHIHVLKTPTEVKHALRYVLTNFSKHAKLVVYIDEFSSGRAFKEWRLLVGRKMNQMLSDYLESERKFRHPELSEPQSWLAHAGWKRAA